MAFVAVALDGTSRLWVRTFSASSAQQLNGTEGAMLPFWSPDSRRIGFFAEEASHRGRGEHRRADSV